ncbi:MAG: nucleoside deaminase [Candidatus Omnitrophota bacterium]
MANKNHAFMQLAINEARKNLELLNGGPFGACIIKKGKILALSRNTVIKNNDPTSHAELNAIKITTKKLKNFNLSGCKIYSTTEPCPMCFSAIHWAKIDKIYYGTKIDDVKKLGFNELAIKNTLMKKLGKSKVKIYPKFMLKECKELLSDWKKLPTKIKY